MQILNEYLQKERERWRRDRETGKKKEKRKKERKINELTERGKQTQRKKWRESRKAARAKACTMVELQNSSPNSRKSTTARTLKASITVVWKYMNET